VRFPVVSREQQYPVKGVDNANERSSTRLTIEHVAFKPMRIEAGHAGSTKRKSRLALRTFNFTIGRHANRTLRRESRHPAFSSVWSFLPSQAAFTNNKAVSRLLRRRHQISLWHQTFQRKKIAPTGICRGQRWHTVSHRCAMGGSITHPAPIRSLSDSTERRAS
jgi:hypothetical protein